MTRGAPALLLLALAALPLSSGESPLVQVAGLRVVAAPQPGSELRAFFWDADLGVALLVRAGERRVIGLDAGKSRVDRLADDLGNDLSRLGDQRAAIELGEVDRDGRACMVTVSGPRAPLPGARQLALEGSLAILTASRHAKARSAATKLASGARLAIGAVQATVPEAGVGGLVPGRFNAVLRFPEGDDIVRSLTVLDSRGAEIVVEQHRRLIPGVPGVDRFIIFPSEPGLVTIECSLWEDLQAVEVPLRLSVGVGLGGG